MHTCVCVLIWNKYTIYLLHGIRATLYLLRSCGGPEQLEKFLNNLCFALKLYFKKSLSEF